MTSTTTKHITLFTAIALLLGFSGAASNSSTTSGAAPRPQQGGLAITLEEVTSAVERPVYLTHAGDGSGRLFIVEQEGRVRVWQNGQLLAAPFLEIESEVEDGGNEQGLLSIAFHPQYETNGRFFVYYTAEGEDDPITIAEYTASPPSSNVANTTERILLTIPHPQFENHNGGQLQFGPDGYLYIGTGDGGGGGDPFENGQNIDVRDQRGKHPLLAKILRIDVDGAPPYGIPSDNPYAGGARVNDEIYAIGFRNPWRFSFDRQTGELYAADVGQNQWEEIDIVAKGGNYGWNTMEGEHCYDPASGCNTNNLVLPIYEYNHSEGCSITGGYVYRGARSPALVGTYIFADYCEELVWGLKDGVRMNLLARGDLQLGITSFGEDEAGELYVLTGQGVVSRIVGPEGPGGEDLAVTGCNPSSGDRRATLEVTITGTGFLEGATVSFGRKINVLETTVISPTEIRVSIKIKKARRGLRDIVVTNPGGDSATGVNCFTVN
jgi:glucose/arabinose dehydrogenase